MEDGSSEKIWINTFRPYQVAKVLFYQSRRSSGGLRLNDSSPLGRGPLIPSSIDGLLQDQTLTIGRRDRPLGARSSGIVNQPSLPLLCQGVIVEVPAQERGLGFYSNLFIIPKPNGDVRPIFSFQHCRTLNDNCAVVLHCTQTIFLSFFFPQVELSFGGI